MKTPKNLRYTEDHEWISVSDDGIGTVGITDHAQNELSDVVYVELPEVGREVGAGDQVAVVESVKAASDIYAPVYGEIVEVNSDLENEPGAINADPYGEGWIFKIKLNDPSELDDLKSAEEYDDLVG
ncbi:MAG: glycine cleavage system protein GcvH [Verrucomicrobiales bacterium]